MMSTSRFVLRGALAGAIALLAFTNFGAPAMSQQVAVNTEDGVNPEDQTALAPSSDEERPADAETRQIVPFHTHEAPGTIIVDTGERHLYLVQSGGQAIQYGIGVGRIGFQWSGVERVSQKQEWPDWRVPAEMIGRQPYLPRFMAGGPGNPLGARALYLGHTVFRIHGTNQPETIGHAVSSGCFRLDNADVIDLYNRVQVGAKVLVKQSAPRFLTRAPGSNPIASLAPVAARKLCDGQPALNPNPRAPAAVIFSVWGRAQPLSRPSRGRQPLRSPRRVALVAGKQSRLESVVQAT